MTTSENEIFKILDQIEVIDKKIESNFPSYNFIINTKEMYDLILHSKDKMDNLLTYCAKNNLNCFFNELKEFKYHLAALLNGIYTMKDTIPKLIDNYNLNNRDLFKERHKSWSTHPALELLLALRNKHVHLKPVINSEIVVHFAVWGREKTEAEYRINQEDWKQVIKKVKKNQNSDFFEKKYLPTIADDILDPDSGTIVSRYSFQKVLKGAFEQTGLYISDQLDLYDKQHQIDKEARDKLINEIDCLEEELSKLGLTKLPVANVTPSNDVP